MKRFMLILLSMVALINTIHSTTVNGRVILSTTNDSTFDAKIQINTNTGNDDFGGATIVINYDSTRFFLPSILSPDTDYVFHNFNGGNYSTAFITRPFSNELWINIELESNNNGTVVSGINSWTDLVTIKMKSLNSQPSTVSFLSNSPFWAIFDGNNSTIWENGNFTSSSVIPVELTSFTANVSVNDIQLKWSTASEINNMGFEIQRQDTEGDFIKVGFIEGKGSTTLVQHYSFRESKLPIGKYTYRLKQVDFDGNNHYSNKVEAEIGLPSGSLLAQNYPNPFNPVTDIKFSVKQESQVKLIVYNLIGEVIQELVNNKIAAGHHEVSFNSNNLASGIYVYRLEVNKEIIDTKKMILVR